MRKINTNIKGNNESLIIYFVILPLFNLTLSWRRVAHVYIPVTYNVLRLRRIEILRKTRRRNYNKFFVLTSEIILCTYYYTLFVIYVIFFPSIPVLILKENQLPSLKIFSSSIGIIWYILITIRFLCSLLSCVIKISAE